MSFAGFGQPTQCMSNDDCKLYCPGETPVCEKGFCRCMPSNASSKQECHNDHDCEKFCLPPCDIPYCDQQNSVCHCECD